MTHSYTVTPSPTSEELAEHGSSSPRRRISPRTCSVTGQCAVCLDLFTVDLYLLGDRLCVNETKYVKWYPRRASRQLIHRPDYCNGEVKLYGSTEGLFPTPRTESHHARRAVQP